MAQILLLCFLLAVTNTFLGLTMATTNKPQITLQPISNPPSQSPSIGRKLGKHHHSPTPSPSVAPNSEEKVHSGSEESITSHHQGAPVEGGGDDHEVLGSKGQDHLLSHHHHPFDKSIAGGGVILGGLATTFVVSVFCYIRATRRHELETTSSESS